MPEEQVAVDPFEESARRQGFLPPATPAPEPDVTPSPTVDPFEESARRQGFLPPSPSPTRTVDPFEESARRQGFLSTPPPSMTPQTDKAVEEPIRFVSEMKAGIPTALQYQPPWAAPQYDEQEFWKGLNAKTIPTDLLEGLTPVVGAGQDLYRTYQEIGRAHV